MSIMNSKPNYPKNERGKNPAINLEGWARHFGLKYIIKLSKEDLAPYQWNVMLNSNQIALFRQTQTQQGSQQGLLSTMFYFSTLAELKFIPFVYVFNSQLLETNNYMNETSPKYCNNS